jgi:hypothetical protein
MKNMKNVVLGIAVIAIILLAAIPAVSAFSATLPSSQATTLNPGDTINVQISGLAVNDQLEYRITSSNLQMSANTVSLSSVNMPFGFATGTAKTTLATTGLSSGGATLTVTRLSDGTQLILSGATITTASNLYKGNYAVSITGTPTASSVGIDYSVSGTVSDANSGSGTLILTLANLKSGVITVEVLDSGTSRLSQAFTVVPAGSVTTAPSYTPGTTTITTPISVPVSSGGVSATLAVPAGTSVTSSTGGQVSTIFSAPVTTVPDSSFGKSGTTFSFIGQAVECGPSGTQFGGAGATISFTLTPSQWTAALSQANGDIAGISIRYYDIGSGTWIAVPTTVNVGPSSTTVTAQVAHFTTYGMFGQAPTPDTSASGGGSAAAAPAAAPAMLAPVGYSPTAVTLSHDANGVVSQDYTIETDPAAGFSSAVGISKGTQVVSGTGQPVGEVSATPLPPGTPNASFSRGGSTFVFSGFSVGCEPAGTRFVGGNATISFSLTPSQWAAALGQVDGNTAAMTIQNYNNVSNTWLPVTTTVNTDSHTVSAQITHFSTYAVFYQVTPQTVSTGAPTVAPQTSHAVGASEPGVTPITTMLAPPETPQSPGDQGIVGNFVQWVQHLVSH